MKLEELQALAKEHAKITNEDLDDEALRTSVLHQRWLDILTNEILILRRLEDELKKVYRSTWLYYSGKADQSVYEARGSFALNVLKTELTMFIESDEEYIKAKTMLDLQKEKVCYIEGVMKNINGRTYAIGNAIKWRVFTHCQT